MRRLGRIGPRAWAAAAALALALIGSFAGAQTRGDERRWAPLSADGLHDPANPGIKLKQSPAQALSRLAPDTAGNQVRWAAALEQGQIAPRAALDPNTPVRIREDDILLNQNGGTPMVRFPHRTHTLWLDCSNCHDRLFVPQRGANALSMARILQGEQCGVCHGAVAFPLTECSRCHNTPRTPAAARAARSTSP